MHFRWAWVLVPLVIIVLTWAMSAVNPACSCGDMMSGMGVEHTAEYSLLAGMGLTLIAVTAIVRVLHSNNRDDS